VQLIAFQVSGAQFRHRQLSQKSAFLVGLVAVLQLLKIRRCLRVRDGDSQRSGPTPGEAGMAYKETFWMACDSTEQMRAEYGPFHTRVEAEIEARKLGFDYLLRYEHIVGKNNEIQEVRSVFIELQDTSQPQKLPVKLHTRCASCGESATHEEAWRAEVWADIHEFEHSRHRVRLFEQTRTEGLKEIADWRAQ
jgi:hypothetical protein